MRAACDAQKQSRTGCAKAGQSGLAQCGRPAFVRIVHSPNTKYSSDHSQAASSMTKSPTRNRSAGSQYVTNQNSGLKLFLIRVTYQPYISAECCHNGQALLILV